MLLGPLGDLLAGKSIIRVGEGTIRASQDLQCPLIL